MRHCCEEALRVLRKNKELLLTIIEVFIHDPLYKWALTAKGAERRQRDDMLNSSDQAAREQLPKNVVRGTPVSNGASLLADAAPTTTSSRLPRCREERGATHSQLDTSTTAGLVINADAERALLRVRHKLEGLEEGGPRACVVLRWRLPSASAMVREQLGLQARETHAAWRARWSACCRKPKTQRSCAKCTQGGHRGCDAWPASSS